MNSVLPSTWPSGWDARPAWDVLVSREEFGGEGDQLSLSVAHGIRLRDASEGRAVSEDTDHYRVVQRGDVVINRLVARDGAIAVSPLDGLISPAYWVMKPRRPSDDVRFIAYQLRSAVYLAEITRVSKDMPPAQFDLPWEQFRQMPIVLPPPADQRAIADFLDAETARVDALIASKQQLRDVLDEQFEAQLVGAILGDFDPVAGRGPVNDGCTVPQLGVAVELHRGHDLPSQDRREGKYPVVSSGGVSDHHDEFQCEGPGVVTGRYGTVGEVYYVEGRYWPLNTTLYVSDFRGNDPRWTYYLLWALPLNFDEEKSAVTGINRNVVGQLRFPLPPVERQRKVATRLDLIAERHALLGKRLEQQLHLLGEHRQALITAAVTGALEVPGVAA